MELNKQLENQIVIYSTEDGETQVDVRLENETVWLTQSQIAVLFGTKRPAITKHLKNIYDSKELDECSTCSILEHMGNDGKQKYTTTYYNLDVILSVGYRVNSANATVFRQWANRVLKEYLLKGYSINNRLERLEQRISNTEEKIDFFVRTSLPPIEGIFFDGQIFDAYKFVNDLIRSARKNIVLFDNYIDDTVLTMLDKRCTNVATTIYTKNISKKLSLDIEKHNSQYQEIEIKEINNVHDRFLCIDNIVYHLGASLKDLGKKLFAFSKMEVSTSELLDNINHK